MPTAVNVADSDAITPPNVMKKKSKKNDDSSEEGAKITPASTATKPKQAAAAAQPSIMSFFKQPSSKKNLFSSSSKKPAATKKKSPPKNNDKDDVASLSVLAAVSKSDSLPSKRTSVPTQEELREIVMGTANLDDMDVPDETPAAPLPGEHDSIIPAVSMRNPGLRLKKKSPPAQEEGKKESERKSGSIKEEAVANDPPVEEPAVESTKNDIASAESNNAPVVQAPEEKSDSESTDEASNEKENKPAPVDNASSEADHANDEESQSGNDDDDDDTVDMSPVKQAVANMGEETTEANADDSKKSAANDVPIESITTNTNESGDKADKSIDFAARDEDTTEASSSEKSNATTEPKSPPAAKKPAAKSCPSKPAAVPDGIPEERRAAYAKNETLRTQYQSRLEGLIQRAHEGIEEAIFQLPAPDRVETLLEEGTKVSSPSEFPECAIRSLALLVQESHLPLTDLAATALLQLKDAFPEGVEFHAEGIAAKIKLLATRESYVQVSSARIADPFEDENADRMWRWEIVSLDLLPDEYVPKIKKARTQRKKIRGHSKALCTLLKYLDQSTRLLEDPKSSKVKCDDLLAKISTAEEKVLKYEREEEKVRLATEAKKQNEASKSKQLTDKQKEKAAAAEQKKREKASAAEQKKREKELKKQEKEEKKRKKEEEKQKAELEKERKIKKQRTMMASFFTHKPSSVKKTKKSEPTEKPAAIIDTKPPAVNQTDLWSRVNSSDKPVKGPLFPTLSSRAVASRKRRIRIVPVDVFASVMPTENAFDAQPYAELQTIQVRNRYKFLSFREDCRPPYHGTWSKTSSLVTGRNPVAKDSQYLDYDVDSEAEWEEGDDEIGEDCEADGPDDEDHIDEEGDTRMYNYQDGWLAADDDLGIDDEDVDEDTKLLRQKKLRERAPQQKAIADQPTICIIAPGEGGIPSDDIVDSIDEAERIEGVNAADARDLLVQHTGTVLQSEGLFLDAFPPPLTEEGDLIAAPAKNGTASGKSSSNNEMSRTDLVTFVEFVHHSEFASKDKLVEELRTKHENVTSSRAQATRKLDSIAEKKRYPGGCYWEVRKEILEELGLNELLNKEFELPPQKPASEKKASKPKASPSSASRKKTPSESTTPAASGKKTASSSEKSSSKKKRPSPSAESVALFAKFLKKKPKTDG